MSDALTQASLLRFNGDLDGAVQLLTPLYEASPWDARVWKEMAAVCVMAKDYDRAASILTAIHEVEPLNPEPCYQLAALYDTTGQYGWALSWAKRALERVRTSGARRGWILTHALAGEIAYKVGNGDEGARHWASALHIPPTDGTEGFAQAEILLAQGQWKGGWRMLEYRWQVAEQWRIQKRHQTKPEHLAPEWDGKAEGRVAVFAEQGSGDTIQFLRFLPLVMGATTSVLVCQPELVSLVQRWIPGLTVVPNGTRIESDWSVPIMSLPYHLGLTTIPAPFPPILHRKPREGSLRVGVCWKGSSDHGNDKDRSYPSHLLNELRDLPVDLISLQHGEPTRFRDFAATAEVVESCDLVVSVDTALCHLSGTLGVPTIVMPPTRPEFRFPRADGDGCVWYPSVTCVRREKAWEWEPAIQKVRQLILERANG